MSIILFGSKEILQKKTLKNVSSDSHKRYENTCATFKNWCKMKCLSIDENTLVAYFVNRKQKLNAPGFSGIQLIFINFVFGLYCIFLKKQLGVSAKNG